MTVYAYITNNGGTTPGISVVDTDTNTVTATIALASARPYGVAI